MNFAAPIRYDRTDAELDSSVSTATQALLGHQHDDGHWCFELEADATIPSEYILLRHYLDEALDVDLERKISRYLRRNQCGDGGWALYHAGPSDVSASTKAYFALKMAGADPDEPHMVAARTFILANGGARRANVFTRIMLALYEQVPWSTIPTMPVEMILLPRWFPVHLSKMSYWARTVLVPILVLMALKPKARNPRGIGIAELFTTDAAPTAPKPRSHMQRGWAAFFESVDVLLKGAEPLWPRRTRERAIEAAVAFTRERLNGEDGLGGIYPAMAQSVIMYDALGFGPDHPDRATARGAIEKLLIVHEDEAYVQPCVSPVWDTALAAHALMETGDPKAEQAVADAMSWFVPRQVLDIEGDWIADRPGLRPGGWAFQYANAHYPDTDDTAAVVIAMDRARPKLGDDPVYDEALARAREWIEGMQNRSGGWGAFDADNTYHYLNNIPFADHGALLDPPTVDVSGRCLGMLAQLGKPSDSPHMKAAIAYLEKEQLPDGSWFGRWGVNYVYGTWSALCALNAAGVDPAGDSVRRAVAWLVSVQNADGGWGEDCDSYRLDYDGYRSAASRVSQTSWAMLGLMAAGEADHEAVARGARFLMDAQIDGGLWGEEDYTGGGFPRVFYLRYHGYAKYFPLWALARYRNLKRSNTKRVAWGL